VVTIMVDSGPTHAFGELGYRRRHVIDSRLRIVFSIVFTRTRMPGQTPDGTASGPSLQDCGVFFGSTS
jgi:hypothetical protein